MRPSRPNPETDPFHPPAIPTEVYCVHCGREYESYLIEWHEERVEGKVEGFWCCPTPDCAGRGFGFDIFPTDPDYVGEDGQPMWIDDDEAGDDLALDDVEEELFGMLDDSGIFESPQPPGPGRMGNDDDSATEDDRPW